MNDLTPDPRRHLKWRQLNLSPTTLSDDGRYLVITAIEGYIVLDRETGQELGHLTYAEIEKTDNLVDSSIGDSLLLLIRASENWILLQYSLPELERYSRYVLPTAIDGKGVSVTAVVDHDGRLVALTGGVLSVWDTRTGTILGEPIRLGASPEEAARYQRSSSMYIWPGDPHQVAIVPHDGSVELWDIEQRQRVRTIPTRIDQGGRHNVIFDNTGDRIVSLGENDMLEVWDAETGQTLRASIVVSGVTRLLGFDSAGRVVTHDYDEVEFWDLDTGRQSGLLRLAAPIDRYATAEEGRRLKVGGNLGLPYKLPIIAQDWFDHLCRAFDRGFTESERELLPSRTDLDPPCSTS